MAKQRITISLPEDNLETLRQTAGFYGRDVAGLASWILEQALKTANLSHVQVMLQTAAAPKAEEPADADPEEDLLELDSLMA